MNIPKQGYGWDKRREMFFNIAHTGIWDKEKGEGLIW